MTNDLKSVTDWVLEQVAEQTTAQDLSKREVWLNYPVDKELERYGLTYAEAKTIEFKVMKIVNDALNDAGEL